MTRKLKPKRKPVTFDVWFARYEKTWRYTEQWVGENCRDAWFAALREAKRREKARKK